LSASNDRLDLEDSHTPDNPRLRRIKLPHTISDVFAKLMRSDHVLAPVRDLLGKDLRLHTSKLNMKSAEYGAAVEWHQDWAFYPHTNDDVLAVGIVLNDVGPDNGPLMVFPGTHKGEVFDHHSNGVFAGAMDLEKSGLDLNDAVKLTGPRGSMSIHHARTVHGSDLNRSDRDRMLLLYEIMAADAYPVMGAMTPWPSLAEYDKKLLCGSGTITPRLADVPVRIPQPQPAKTGSIYEIQSTAQKRAFDTVI
jgi:ectoine hydroxylase-related dioxygenase (phytanoyl-CoA dioxygenase family)